MYMLKNVLNNCPIIVGRNINFQIAMRKNVFRMLAQSICIGAIGLLAGTSLDYAYSGYGMLNNPNLWAESTTTAVQYHLVESYKPCIGTDWVYVQNEDIRMTLTGTSTKCAMGTEGISCGVAQDFVECKCPYAYNGSAGIWRIQLPRFTLQ